MGFALGIFLKAGLVIYVGTIITSFLMGLYGDKNREKK